ncbi:MAG TPA: HAMP domain-containing sensor histidine kinase [Micromonosporaceae bacterium]|nr:HAMP domain-containing sensor histidine kinase [Micromonosporaceae bacterium]
MTGVLRGIPLRVKLVAAVLALVTAALVMIGVASAVALRYYLTDRMDTQLHEASRVLRDTDPLVLEANFDKLVLPSDYVLGFSVDGQWLVVHYTFLPKSSLPRLPANKQTALQQAGTPYTTWAHDDSARWRVLVTSRPDGQALIVAQTMSGIDSAVSRLVWIDVLVGGTMLIVLASMGAAIVRTSLRPLVQIEQTAAAIAAGDLTRRVPDPEPGAVKPTSELGRLSRALNAMLAQIEAAFTARSASEAAARAAESAAREAAIAAQASESRARRSEERMRQFVADASHELRTPLTTIRGFAELYRQGAVSSPEETARLVRRIEDEAARMGLLVEDLLLLARLDRERPLMLAPVELPVLASEAVQAARAVAPERNITLEIQPGAGHLVVLGDDARLRQVFGNLMTNALTHTPTEASVTLRLRAEPGTAVVEVADTGPGLSPEQAEHVFERFYRADAARTRRADGATSTGLGLAIVAALVAAHQGNAEVGQTPGGGATFRVRLPRVPPEPPE